MVFKVKRINCCFGLKKMRGLLYLCKVIEWEILFLIVYMWMTSHLLAVTSVYDKNKEVVVLKVSILVKFTKIKEKGY